MSARSYRVTKLDAGKSKRNRWLGLIFGREETSRQIDEHVPHARSSHLESWVKRSERGPACARQEKNVRTNASIATVQLARMKSCKDAGLSKSLN
jgi:hypothetical protein